MSEYIRGKLTVTVHQVANLVKVPDKCHVVLKISNCRQQTSVIHQKTPNPVFEHTFHLGLDYTPDEIIMISIFSTHLLVDDKLGKMTITVANATRMQGRRWYQLVDHDDFSKHTGDMEISFAFMPHGSPSPQPVSPVSPPVCAIPQQLLSPPVSLQPPLPQQQSPYPPPQLGSAIPPPNINPYPNPNPNPNTAYNPYNMQSMSSSLQDVHTQPQKAPATGYDRPPLANAPPPPPMYTPPPAYTPSQSSYGVSTSVDESSTSQSSSSTTPESAMHIFRDFAHKFNIKLDFAKKLRQLGDCKIVILCDDSSSMNADAYTDEFLEDPYMNIPSRWEELKKMVNHVIDFAGVLSKSPVDVFFLNRDGVMNVRSFSEVSAKFNEKASGLTPTVLQLQHILGYEHHTLGHEFNEKKILIFIATDGQPTDHQGDINIPQMDAFLSDLMKKYANVYITFMACVSDEKLLECMDKWGQKFERIGVVDEFNVEVKEMMEKHADDPNFKFTSGDYITKALLVSIDPQIKEVFKDIDD